MGEQRLNVILCRSPDFIVSFRASLLQAALVALVEFDGENGVTAGVEHLWSGVVLDLETEALPKASYEDDGFDSSRGGGRPRYETYGTAPATKVSMPSSVIAANPASSAS
jgi:hypothetical protein